MDLVEAPAQTYCVLQSTSSLWKGAPYGSKLKQSICTCIYDVLRQRKRSSMQKCMELRHNPIMYIVGLFNPHTLASFDTFMRNVYRVLLTRARSGMIICVPIGNVNKKASGFWEDSTRLPEYYDGTYQYLKNLGIEEI